jgi:hypothetical protein
MFIGLVLTFVILSTFSFTAAAQNPVEQEALIRDASQYAATMGVALDEAISRLKSQNAIGDLNAKLVANEEDTFAGLAVEHKPAYRVVARFIRNGEAIIRPYVINGSLATIVEVREAKATLKELKAARIGAAQIAERVSIRAYSAINIPENRAELYVLDLTQLDDALQKAHVQLPANVKVIKVPELPKPVSDIYGGLGLSGACPSGFSVINSNGTMVHPNKSIMDWGSVY